MSQNNELNRGLKARHIEMIAIGGAIGVGLFLGSATTIEMAGPGILFTYGFAGIIIFFIMRALGEMAVEHPVTGSFSTYANDYLGPFHAYMVGWTYWIEWVVICMAELTAIGVYVHFWWPNFPTWATALIGLVVLTIVNLLSASAFGELEFWFALIKVVTIIVMIILSVLMIFTGIFTPDGKAIGIGNLTAHGGLFPHGAGGVIKALVMVSFAFIGVELIGITAGEAENPTKVIPKAINSVSYRILIFYIGALFCILCLYPWDEIGTTGSPFVLTFSKIGISAAAAIINFVVLTAASSSCNSGIYSSGRMLFNLSQIGYAPKALGGVSRTGVPLPGILMSSALILIGVILNYVMPGKVFTIVTSVSSFCAIYIWAMIIIAQLAYRKQIGPQGAEKLLFKMPLYPISNYITLVVLAFIMVVMAVNPDTRIAVYVGVVWMVLLIASYYITGQQKREPVKFLESNK